MKKILLILFLFCSLGSFAQLQQCPQIVFQYDASGNRIQRKLIITACNAQKPVAPENPTEPTQAINMNVYPNPAQDKINIDLEKDDSESESKIELYDMSGKILYSAKSSSLQIQVDVSGFSVGTYLLKIIRGEKYSTYNVLKN